MTPDERRAAGSLSLVFAARMLGLFLVLPVFALEAARYPGGDDPVLVGLAMGIYGLTQGLLQIPYGMASDRFGRKRVILLGLVVFAAGSFLAAAADSVAWLIVGRSLQGAGAVSAAVTALLADQTRDEVRTKAMALVGASIGLMFAISLVASPVVARWIGLAGLFALTGVLALACMAVVVWWTPPEPAAACRRAARAAGRGAAARTPDATERGRLRPARGATGHVGGLARPAGAGRPGQGQPLDGVPAGRHGRRRGDGGDAVPAGAARLPAGRVPGLHRPAAGRPAGLCAAGRPAVAVAARRWCCSSSSVGFNVLEATQPSLASRLAPAHARGAALGVYNTLQSLGFFAGGAVGGWLAKHVGGAGLFAACAGALILWLVVAWPMRAPGRSSSPGTGAGGRGPGHVNPT